MPSRFALLVIVFMLSSLYLARSQPEETSARAAEEQVEALDWLAGSWSGDMWGGRFHAFYSTPEGGTVLSHSRLLKEGKEAFYEFEVFALRDGVVHLQPFPRGAKAVGLRLHSLDAAARTAVFENPDKDYPTRIEYRRTSDDELVITLTDPHGGSDETERFVLGRDPN